MPSGASGAAWLWPGRPARARGPAILVGAVAAGGSAAFAVTPAGTDAPKRRPVDVAPPGQRDGSRTHGRWLTAAILLGIVIATLLVRFWHFNDVGYNSDEAVYAGQGAGIAHDPQLAPYFPVFRAHPLLFQSVVAIGYELHQGDWFGRAAAICFGALCVLATFELGRLLYGVRVGLIAAAVLALMPYHVIVSRQVLLDGPQTFFTTVTLCLLIRFARSGRTLWLCCAAAGMGLSVLAKEPSVIFCGAVYAFFALSPEIRVRLRQALIALAIMVLTIVPYPLALALSGQTGTGGNFLAWQLVRRPNHSLLFYLTAVPVAIGLGVCACAAISLLASARGRRWSWRETLVACWIGVPVAFLELWPVKGFQYLLPLAPVIAVLAADGVGGPPPGRFRARACATPLRGAPGARRGPARHARRADLRGGRAVVAGDVPGRLGRRPGRPRDRPLHPGERARGRDDAHDRPVDGEHPRVLRPPPRLRPLGQPEPPASQPDLPAVANPDLSLRRGDIQYIVWDAFSARRSTHFERRLLSYVSRYRGRAVYTFSTTARSADGAVVRVPLIIVYAVRP